MKKYFNEKLIKKKIIIKFKQKVQNYMKYTNPKIFNHLLIKETLKENLQDI